MFSAYNSLRSTASSSILNTKENVAELCAEALKGRGLCLSSVDYGMVTSSNECLHNVNGKTFSLLYDKHDFTPFAHEDFLTFIRLSSQMVKQHRIIYPYQNRNGDWLLGELFYCPEKKIMHLDIYNSKSNDMGSYSDIISDVLSIFGDICIKINTIPIVTEPHIHGSAIVVIDLVLKLLDGQGESLKCIHYTDAQTQKLELDYKDWLCGVHHFDYPPMHDSLTTQMLKRNRSFTI